MIECKVLATNKLRASKLRANEDHETRIYWPAYTLSLRVGDNPPITLHGWHYVTIDGSGDMEISDHEGAEYGIPRVTEVASGQYCVNTWEDEDFEIDYVAGRGYEIKQVIRNAADSIDYVDPGE